MKRVLTGVVLAALVALSAGASAGAKDVDYIELCGPSSCARTTNPGAVAQFKAFIPQANGSQLPGFPPPVQPYYKLRASGLKYSTVFVGGAGGQMGVFLRKDLPTWADLGPVTLQELVPIEQRVRPFAAPAPAGVLVNNEKVRARPIYRHLFDAFPQAVNVAASTKPWIGVKVTWPKGSPWPTMSVTLRRGTRLMLRPDHAVTVSKALAARILADVPKKH